MNSFIDVICTSDIKTRHIYAFLIGIAIIVVFFLYGIILKSILKYIKLKFFLYHQQHIPEFDEIIISKKDIEQDVLKTKLQFGMVLYFFAKLVGGLFLSGSIITLITLKYTLPSARDLFLPLENACGPNLVRN